MTRDEAAQAAQRRLSAAQATVTKAHNLSFTVVVTTRQDNRHSVFPGSTSAVPRSKCGCGSRLISPGGQNCGENGRTTSGRSRDCERWRNPPCKHMDIVNVLPKEYTYKYCGCYSLLFVFITDLDNVSQALHLSLPLLEILRRFVYLSQPHVPEVKILPHHYNRVPCIEDHHQSPPISHHHYNQDGTGTCRASLPVE